MTRGPAGSASVQIWQVASNPSVQGHADVHEDDVRAVVARLLDGVGAIRCFGNDRDLPWSREWIGTQPGRGPDRRPAGLGSRPHRDEGKLGADNEPTVGGGFGVKRAADRRGAFAHAGDAVARPQWH